MDANHSPALGAVRSGGRSPLWGLRLAVGLGCALLAVEIVFVALTSPRLAVREVTVRGERQMAELAAKAIHLPANTNLLRAPVDLVKRQAESVPAVREARVGRAFPAGLVVTVERREAVAVIRRGEQALLIDPEGVPFTVPEEWGWGLPELVGPRLGSGEVEEARGEIALLLSVLRALGPDPRLRATRLQLGREGRIEVTLDSGAKVNLGNGKELGAKVRLLVAALEQIGADRIERLDLGDPAGAFWEPREDVIAAAMR